MYLKAAKQVAKQDGVHEQPEDLAGSLRSETIWTAGRPANKK
jgi:hypothetical protein